MTYDSSKIDERQVGIFQKLIMSSVEGFWSSEILLAFAQALEQSASEVRQMAVERGVNDAAKNQLY